MTTHHFAPSIVACADAVRAVETAWPPIADECRAVLGGELHYQAVVYHCLRLAGVPRDQIQARDLRKHADYRGGFNAVGRPDVQAFVGSLVGLGATKGVFVTTSTFSTQAQDFVKHLSQRVILIDGSTLGDLMIEHGVGVRTAQTIALRRLDEDFFAEGE